MGSVLVVKAEEHLKKAMTKWEHGWKMFPFWELKWERWRRIIQSNVQLASCNSQVPWKSNLSWWISIETQDQNQNQTSKVCTTPCLQSTVNWELALHLISQNSSQQLVWSSSREFWNNFDKTDLFIKKNRNQYQEMGLLWLLSNLECLRKNHNFHHILTLGLLWSVVLPGSVYQGLRALTPLALYFWLFLLLMNFFVITENIDASHHPF